MKNRDTHKTRLEVACSLTNLYSKKILLGLSKVKMQHNNKNNCQEDNGRYTNTSWEKEYVKSQNR